MVRELQYLTDQKNLLFHVPGIYIYAMSILFHVPGIYIYAMLHAYIFYFRLGRI